MNNAMYLLIAFGLVLLNGFFVAAEFSIIRLRQTRIEAIQQKYGMQGRILAKIHKHLDAYLSACQLGITIASIGLGWIGEPAFANLIEPLLAFFGIFSHATITVTAFSISFLIVSYLHIVIGELMPKSLAIRQSESIALLTAIPLYTFYWITYPGIWFLNVSSNFLLKKIRLDQTHFEESIYSPEEIKLVLSASHTHGKITSKEAEIIEHALDLNELKVTDVMTPVERLVSLSIDMPIGKIINTIRITRYSRYPVYKDQLSNMVGIIHVKDLFIAQKTKLTLKDFEKLLRPILKVKSSLSAIELLRHIQQGKSHLAVIYHEEALIGFVTLDKLLSFILGEIRDEFHLASSDIKKIESESFTMKGSDSIYALEQALGFDLILKEDVRTIGGLVLYTLGYIPPLDTTIQFDKFKIVVTKVKRSRILEVKIYRKV